METFSKLKEFVTSLNYIRKTKAYGQILLLLAVDNVSIFCSRVKHTELSSHEVNSIKDDPTDTAMSRGLRLTDARTRTPQHPDTTFVAETTDWLHYLSNENTNV